MAAIPYPHVYEESHSLTVQGKGQRDLQDSMAEDGTG